MPALTIHPDDPTPLTEQIVAALRRAIATGALTVGDELPPVRQLAADLAVNLNTVARAYNVLQDVGLIRTARGRGTRVISAHETVSPAATPTHRPLADRFLDVIADAKLRGLSAQDTRAMLDAALAECFPDQPEAPVGPAAGSPPSPRQGGAS